MAGLQISHSGGRGSQPGRVPLDAVTARTARYLPVLPCWALLVAALLPRAPLQ